MTETVMASSSSWHVEQVSHKYQVAYPEHGPRTSDPHYIDFEHHRNKTKDSATCYVADRLGHSADCAGGLELHHAHIEWSLVNGVSWEALEVDYPGISNPDEVGAWVESDENLRWLCERHHRGLSGGAHVLAHADWEAESYVPGMTVST